jgi:hypothetical protein
MNSGGMMKRSYVLLLVIFVMTLLPAVAFSQYIYFPGYIEFNTLGGGARAAGMGGAFLGLAEGEYAYSWNPAGMIFDEKRSIGLQLVSSADKFTTPNYSFFDTNGVYTVSKAEVKREHLNLDFGGFVTPFTFMDREWAVGGGYRNVYDMALKYENAGNFNSRNVFTQTDGVDAVSVSIAGKVIEGIGIGITANNYIRGTETNSYIGKAIIYHPPSNPVPDTVDYWFNDNSHYSGFNLDLGLSGEFSMVKGGVVLHTPYDLKQNSKITESLMIPPTPVGAINRLTTKTSIPLSFSIGLSVKPIDKLVVAADFDSRPMSKSDVTFNYESTALTDSTHNPAWEDLNQFRIGVEYTLKAGFADIPLRVGFRNNPSVEKEITSNTNGQKVYGSQITTNLMTFGTGVHFDKAWVDLAYQFGSSSYNSTINFGTAMVIEQKRDYSRLLVSAGMNF